MARAGITKYSVEKARNLLISKGVNPSIDAIRVELGNTGSKTTISRYLKELEADESVQLEDEALLSEGIKDIIAKLASKLHQEAKEVIAKSESRLQETIKSLETKNRALIVQLDEQKAQLEKSLFESEQISESNQSLKSDIETLRTRLIESNSHNKELESILKEKEEQIDTLKESHKHTRESLEHYRVSVKEQREQGVRQHEQQLQQLHGEIRQLNQTLIVKQTDITSLNKDSSRLVTELKATQKEKHKLEDATKVITQKYDKLEHDLFQAKSAVERLTNEKERNTKEITELVQYNDALAKRLHEYELINVKLETELSIQKDFLNRQERSG
ncbi:integrase [Aliikangiella marina]|uniref:Integrase n=1 Tax=Aliikangiella marina TaxID=1712262 RepID=A0A545TJD7_9GAMM|nr:DNA-binding protein [Aliikangiella marina]TQV77342.1 integrase [Aliikangiella marina]